MESCLRDSEQVMEVRDAETGELLVLRMPEPLPPPRSPTRQRTTHDNGVHAETQSKRKLGDNVAWQHKQLDRIEVLGSAPCVYVRMSLITAACTHTHRALVLSSAFLLACLWQ